MSELVRFCHFFQLEVRFLVVGGEGSEMMIVVVLDVVSKNGLGFWLSDDSRFIATVFNVRLCVDLKNSEESTRT